MDEPREAGRRAGSWWWPGGGLGDTTERLGDQGTDWIGERLGCIPALTQSRGQSSSPHGIEWGLTITRSETGWSGFER